MNVYVIGYNRPIKARGLISQSRALRRDWLFANHIDEPNRSGARIRFTKTDRLKSDPLKLSTRVIGS